MKRLIIRSFYLLLIIISLVLAGFFLQPFRDRNGLPINKQDQLVQTWQPDTARFQIDIPTALSIDTSNNIVVFHRAGREWPYLSPMPSDKIPQNTIVVLDSNTGAIINSWGNNQFIMPHGLTVDKHNNIWVTDVGLHQIFKFTNDGRLIMKLGIAGIPGNDRTHFDKPTGIAVAPDGSFYVSDGYGNSRIMKFSASGKLMFEWGKRGSGKGEFNVPHSITLDDDGNVYVADRGNKRIQLFNSSGKYISTWTDPSFGQITAVFWDRPRKRLIATDDVSYLYVKHRGSDVYIFDKHGKIAERFGRTGGYDGSVCWYHGVCADNEGNIFVADLLGNGVMKFGKVHKAISEYSDLRLTKQYGVVRFPQKGVVRFTLYVFPQNAAGS